MIDEEDYQVAQARGDEDLPPTWDEVLEDDINGDGVLDEEEFGLLVEEDGDWEEVDPFGESMMEIFGEEMVMTMIVTGTWEAQDDRFTLEPVETIVTINELTLAEFYTEIFNLMIDAVFEESGLSEDEFLARIAEDEDTVAPETLDEWKATMIEELLTEMDEVGAFETETFEYAINGDEMLTTDSIGEPLVFVRLDARSAVDAVSWGQIKAMQPKRCSARRVAIGSTPTLAPKPTLIAEESI